MMFKTKFKLEVGKTYYIACHECGTPKRNCSHQLLRDRRIVGIKDKLFLSETGGLYHSNGIHTSCPGLNLYDIPNSKFNSVNAILMVAVIIILLNL